MIFKLTFVGQSKIELKRNQRLWICFSRVQSLCPRQLLAFHVLAADGLWFMCMGKSLDLCCSLGFEEKTITYGCQLKTAHAERPSMHTSLTVSKRRFDWGKHCWGFVKVICFFVKRKIIMHLGKNVAKKWKIFTLQLFKFVYEWGNYPTRVYQFMVTLRNCGPDTFKKYLAGDWVNHLPIIVYCELTSTTQIKSRSSNSTTPSAFSSTLTEVM